MAATGNQQLGRIGAINAGAPRSSTLSQLLRAGTPQLLRTLHLWRQASPILRRQLLRRDHEVTFALVLGWGIPYSFLLLSGELPRI